MNRNDLLIGGANELFPGAQTVVYVEKEVTYGVARSITGTNSFRTISESLNGAEEREMRPDRSGSADHLERYQGRKSAEWEVSKLILPSGSVTTQPDDTHMWENLFGSLSMGASSIEYILATAHTSSLTIRRGIRTGGGVGLAELGEHVRGAIVSGGEIAWGANGNNGLAQVTFRGSAKEYGYTGNTSLGAGYPNIATNAGSFRLANSKQVTVGSILQIGQAGGPANDTGGGSGILVTGVNQTTQVISFANTLDATHSSNPLGVSVVVYNPTETTAGSPIHARIGALSLDGSTTKIDHLGGSVSIEDNRGLLNEEVGYDSATRVMRNDRRNVTFSLDFLVKKDEIGTLLGSMVAKTSQDIQVNIGSIPNNTIKLIMANGDWDFTSLDVPEQEMVRLSMSGVALGTNGNDSIKVRFM
jgi:hypothetical protein